MKSNLEVIGRNAHIEFIDHVKDVPAKVDTGADSSSVWASNVFIDTAHRLHFTLFDKGSEYYTGEEIIAEKYSVSRVRSSSGHTQIRYRATLPVRLANRRINVRFTLADRRRNLFPVLIGRRTLAEKFVVDVTQAECDEIASNNKKPLNEEFIKDPHAFYKKYHQNNDNDDKVKK